MAGVGKFFSGLASGLNVATQAKQKKETLDLLSQALGNKGNKTDGTTPPSAPSVDTSTESTVALEDTPSTRFFAEGLADGGMVGKLRPMTESTGHSAKAGKKRKERKGMADGGFVGGEGEIPMMQQSAAHEDMEVAARMMMDGMEPMPMDDMTGSRRLYNGREVVNHSGPVDFSKK